MFLIAHRANTNGPDPENENTIEAVNRCLGKQLSVEIDVTLEHDKFFLGHDELNPEDVVNIEQLVDSRIWVHSKTVETFEVLTQHSGIQTFYQANDNVSLTSNGYLWCHSAYAFKSDRSILTMLDRPTGREDVYAVCTDYTELVPQVPVIPPFKVLVLDVDGVMTDGTKTYDVGGYVTGKNFSDKDFTAIKRFQAAGIEVVFLTGDTKVIEEVAVKRHIDLMSARGQDKIHLLPQLMREYGVLPSMIAFVGDDYYDLLLMESLQHTYCPSDALPEIRTAAKTVLPCKGGEGVVAALLQQTDITRVYPTWS